MGTAVYILGGSQTDFSRNWAREDLEVYDMFSEVLRDAISARNLLNAIHQDWPAHLRHDREYTQTAIRPFCPSMY